MKSEIFVDLFAGGGGTSSGVKRALGRAPHVAINHKPSAINMHIANHPETKHYLSDIYGVDPVEACDGHPIGGLWLSPDCTHFSRAKGGGPVQKNIRDLAWIAIKWIDALPTEQRPRIIYLENVPEFVTWGPLDENNRPIKARSGETFKEYVAALEARGYVVEWRKLRARLYGAATLRERLYMIARRDGEPIVWPEPTHGGEVPYRMAADIIDWSLPCPSIFMTKEDAREYFKKTGIRVNRPLKENTLRRIARGVQRYVIESADPFIVPVTHQGDARVYSINEPLRTITGANRGEQALITPFISKFRTGSVGQAMDQSLATITANSFVKRAGGAPPLAVIAPYLVQTAHGERDKNGKKRGRGEHTVTGSLGTITASNDNAVVAAHLMNLKGTDAGRGGMSMRGATPTQTSKGNHVAEVRAFLIKYFGTDQDPRLEEPLHTITSKPRFGLVMVHGEPYEIVDIGMRMLTPRELFNAQGFDPDYEIDFYPDGRRISKSDAIDLCGNSVCPDVAAALIRANQPDEEWRIAA